MKILRLVSFSAAALLSAAVASAGLVGVSVTGSLQFNGGGLNYFDPANFFVPAGNLNTAGTTVTVSASATEFGFADGVNTDLANFTDTQLIITDNMTSAGAAPWKMTFTSNAFTGLSFSLASSDFIPGLTSSLVGNVITVNYAGVGSTTAGLRTAIFNVGSVGGVPEGGSTALLFAGALLGGAVITRRLKLTR